MFSLQMSKSYVEKPYCYLKCGGNFRTLQEI